MGARATQKRAWSMFEEMPVRPDSFVTLVLKGVPREAFDAACDGGGPAPGGGVEGEIIPQMLSKVMQISDGGGPAFLNPGFSIPIFYSCNCWRWPKKYLRLKECTGKPSLSCQAIEEPSKVVGGGRCMDIPSQQTTP